MKQNYFITGFLLVLIVNISTGCSNSGGSAPSTGANPAAAPANPGSNTPQQTNPTPNPQTIPQNPQQPSVGSLSPWETKELVDITNLDVYRQKILPLLRNLQAPNRSKPLDFDSLIKARRWHLGNFDLSAVDATLLSQTKMTVGTNAKPQLFAVQSMTDVWIDLRVWNSLPNKDYQGDSLLTEIMTGAYLLRFLPPSELCKLDALFQPSMDHSLCLKLGTQLDQANPSEKPRALGSLDISYIKLTTRWLEEHASEPVLESEFIRFLFNTNFDRRFFNTQWYDDQGHYRAPLTLSNSELMSALEYEEIKGLSSALCSDKDALHNQPCHIDFTQNSIFWIFNKSLKMNVSIEGQSIFQLVGPSPDSVTLNPGPNLFDGQIIYEMELASPLSSLKAGSAYTPAMLIFKKVPASEAFSLVLASVVIQPQVVKGVSQSSNGQTCYSFTSPPKTNTLADGLIVHSSQQEPLLYENFLLNSVLQKTCVN